MNAAFMIREGRFIDEQRFLYRELCNGGKEDFQEFREILRTAAHERSAGLKKRDMTPMYDPEWYKKSGLMGQFFEGEAVNVRVSFTKKLNEPRKLNRAFKALLDKLNEGVSALIICDLQKMFLSGEPGPSDVKKLHAFFRLLRTVTELVAPGTLLLLDLRNSPYSEQEFTVSPEKPELHGIYDDRFLPAFLSTFATQDTRLLQRLISENRKNAVYGRTLVVNKTIPWNLDYGYLRMLQMDEDSHRDFLNHFYTGKFEGSFAVGKTRKEGEHQAIAGSIDDLLGLTRARETGNSEALREAYNRKALGYALILSMGGIPFVEKADLSGTDPEASDLRQLMKKLTRSYTELFLFDSDADQWALNTDNNHILVMGRYKLGRKFYAIFNFSTEEQVFAFKDPGTYMNLMNGKMVEINALLKLKPLRMAWLLQKPEEEE